MDQKDIALDVTRVSGRGAAPDRTQSAADAEHPFTVERPDDEHDLPQANVRRYALLRELGRGGLGRILEAEDRTLKRKVAIKELHVAGGKGQARFLREALVTARLQHPSIVPLYDAGRWPTGEPYYSMKLVSGRPLTAIIADAHTLDARLALLPHVIAVAEAMAYAHGQRIVHRDLKPANVLVGEFGETVVIDWGLAKDLAAGDEGEAAPHEGPWRTPAAAPEAVTLTRTGEMLGTPIYIAPEQAQGRSVDERADVYAIGAILYQLLTGTWPFTGTSTQQVVAKVLAGELTPVAERQPGVPPDLAAVVHKAMARQPEQRYATAAELAADLKRFQAGQLVAAHHYPRATLARRWLARHRGLVAMAGVLAALLAGSIFQVVRERNQTRRERDRLILAQARGALERDPTAAVAWLKTYPTSGEDLEGARAIALEAESLGVARHVLRHGSTVPWGSFSPDGRRFATSDGAGAAVIVDVESGRVEASLPGRTRIWRAQWSPDGGAVALTDDTRKEHFTLWRPETGSARRIEGLSSTALLPASFSPDGRLVAFPGADGKVHLVGVDGESSREVVFPSPARLWAHFLPDGRELAALGADNHVYLADLEGGGVRRLESTEGATPRGMPIVHAAALAIMCGADLCWWSLDDGTPHRLRGHTGGPVLDLDLSADGKTLVSLGSDRTLRAWSLADDSGRVVENLAGNVDWISFVAGGRVLTAGEDGQVRLTDVATGEARTVARHPEKVVYLAVSPDGRWLATMAGDHATRLWPLRAEAGRALRGPEDRVLSVAFSPDDRLLAGAALDRTLNLWQPATGERQVLEGHMGGVIDAAFSPDGQFLASAGEDGEVWLWELAYGKGRTVGRHRGAVWQVAISPLWQVASAGADGAVGMWSFTGAGELMHGHEDTVYRVAFSPDGTWLASGGVDGTVRLWSATSWEDRVLGRHDGALRGLAVSPRGDGIATTGLDGKVMLWKVPSGEPRVLGDHLGTGNTLAFSPDGARVAAPQEDGTVLVWRLADGERRRLAGHRAPARSLAFSPDGARLVTGGLDGTVRVWDVAAGAAWGVLAPGRAPITAVAWSHDGRTIAAASGSAAHVWAADAVFTLPRDGAGLADALGRMTDAAAP